MSETYISRFESFHFVFKLFRIMGKQSDLVLAQCRR